MVKWVTQKIYTSYFGNLAKLLYNFSPGHLVSIARSPPLQFTGMAGVRSYKILAPSWTLLDEWRRGMTPSEYLEQFERETLSQLNPEVVLKDLLQDRDSAVLLCYEPPGKFCHRHIVADWLEVSELVHAEEYQ